jgi:hypothetical protein
VSAHYGASDSSAVIDLVESVQNGFLRRRELNLISERLALACARQSLLARPMEECGHERDWRGVYNERTVDANGSLDAFIRSGNSEAG